MFSVFNNLRVVGSGQVAARDHVLRYLVGGVVGVAITIAFASPASAVFSASDREFAPTSDRPVTPKFVPGEAIVRYRAGVTKSRRSATRRQFGVRFGKPLGLTGLELVTFDPKGVVSAKVKALEADSDVLYAEPNYIRQPLATPNDANYPYEWGLNNTGQSINAVVGVSDADIDAPEAWDLTTGSTAVVTAVVDTGVDWQHPDLAPNIWQNPGEAGALAADGLDNDGNGYIDDYHGWDFGSDDNNPDDMEDHGTHVAGTIGAKGNDGIGVSGVNWNTSIMPLKVVDDFGSFVTSAGIVAAFNYAAANGAKVVNGSFGGGPSSQAEIDSISAAANTLFVFAAGNEGTNNDVAPMYPCSYTAANIVCVAATNAFDALTDFSNFGAGAVDIAAPGNDVLSTVPGWDIAFSDKFDDGSMADWTTGGTPNPWGVTTEWAASPSYSMTDSPAGDYVAGQDNYAWHGVDLTGRSRCQARFMLGIDSDYGDGLSFWSGAVGDPLVQVGGMWGGLGVLEAVYPLTDVEGVAADVAVQFTDTPGGIEYRGAFVDDFVVRCRSTISGPSDYDYYPGTSMASPHVAGAAALVWSKHPTASVATVKNALLGGADIVASHAGKTMSGARLNLRNALDLPTFTPPGPPPIVANPGNLPPPSTAPRPPFDFLVSAKPKQRVVRQKGVIVKVWCGEPCSALGNGATSIRKVKSKLQIKTNLKSVPGKVQTTMKLKLSRKQLAVLTRALKKRKTAWVTVSVTATSATGEKITRKKKIAVAPLMKRAKKK